MTTWQRAQLILDPIAVPFTDVAVLVAFLAVIGVLVVSLTFAFIVGLLCAVHGDVTEGLGYAERMAAAKRREGER